MKNPKESRGSLHQLLLDEDLYSKSYDEFETQFANDSSRAKLYDLLVSSNLYSKSVEDFNNQFFGDLVKKKPLQDGIGDVLAPVFADPQGGSQVAQTPSPEQPIASPDDQGEILVNAPQVQKDFGQMSIEDIDAQLRQEIAAEKQKQSAPGFALPDEQSQMAFDRPGQQMPPSRAEMDANVFEQKKDHLKGLIAKEDRAKMADELQKYSGVMIDNIDKGIAQVREDAKKKGVFMGGSPNSPIIPNDNEYKQKIEVMNMAKEILENVKDTPDQGGFLDGLASKGVTGVLPFIGGIAEGKALGKIMKASNDGAKNEAEETLLTAEQLRKEFESAKENPDGYRWGRVLAEMIPYIGEYAATSGVYTGARGLATEGLKSILKGAATKPAVLNGVVKPISTLVGISAQTAVNPTRVINTTYERMTPQMKLALDLDKNELKAVIEPLGKPGEGFKEAFAKAFGVNALELLTERFGQWSKEAGDAMKLNGDWLPQIVFGKWMEKRGFIDLAKAKAVAKQIGYDGIIQEIWFEEYPNKILQNAVTGDQKWSPDFFNPLSQEFIDMIPATLVMGGGALGAGAFGKYMDRLDREDRIAKLKKVMEAEATATPTGEDIGTKPGDFTNLEKLVAEQEAKADEKPQEQPPAVEAEGPVVPEAPKEEALSKKAEPEKQVDIPSDLQERGEQVPSTLVAKTRFGNGDRIFAFPEQDAEPVELTSVEQMDKYTSDQLMAYKPQEKVDPTEPGGEKFEELRQQLESATGEEYDDDAVQAHVDASGGWDAEEDQGKPTEEVVQPNETEPKYSVDVARLQDDGSVKRIREEVEGKPYKKYPTLGLFSHPSVSTDDYYSISEAESGIQVVQAKTKKEAEQKLDQLVTQYGGEEAFKGVMAEQIAKVKKNQKAQEEANKPKPQEEIKKGKYKVFNADTTKWTEQDEPYTPREGWETHLIKAREYAVNLGIEPKGKGLSDLVGEIYKKLEQVQPEKNQKQDDVELEKPEPKPAEKKEPRKFRSSEEVSRISAQTIPSHLRETEVTIKNTDGKPVKMKAKDAYVEMKRLHKLLTSQQFIDCIGKAR